MELNIRHLRQISKRISLLTKVENGKISRLLKKTLKAKPKNATQNKAALSISKCTQLKASLLHPTPKRVLSASL